MPSLSISRADSRRSALRGLVDYAGLFPPAALDMEGAVAGYREARESGVGWVVDRFICPASRLEELLTVLAPTMTAGEEPWCLAVTVGWVDALTADSGAVRAFAETAGSAASVELVEIRVPEDVAPDPEQLGAEAAQILLAFRAMPFFEVSWRFDPGPTMDALESLREESGRSLGVKLRCGGLDAGLFPSPAEVARFIGAAAARGLPMKATAGLHHPYRHVDARTGFAHHGFINLLAAAAFARRGEPETTVAAILADDDPASFALDRAGLAWRGERVSAAALDTVRSQLFVAYGSCSFDEPVADLTALGVLPVEPS